jgi:putative Mg2+ transporter-C (MgtC) family protein
VVLGYPAIASRLPASQPFAFAVRVVYEDGRGILRDVLGESTDRGFAVQRVTTQQLETRAVGGVPAVAVTLEVHGQPGVESLVTSLDDLPGVLEVTTTELGQDAD